jgi:hypothetical protein
MRLEQFLTEHRTAIITHWVDAALGTYPDDTVRFLKKQKDRFTNPVGHTVSTEIEHIFDELCAGVDPARIIPFLDNIIRIRAVQDFTPSQAVSFIFALKDVIRAEIDRDGSRGPSPDELLDFLSRIDTAALLAFDIFVQCREKLYDIKANELRNMTFRLVQRANKIGETKEEESDLTEGDNDNEQQREVTQ